ncbi:MAG: hypothetical protein ACKVU0_20970 [Saprospiraceae bacterium]
MQLLLLLTASTDKTAKLWDIASGSLLRTFRPPIGEGKEGMFFAAVRLPDERLEQLVEQARAFVSTMQPK